MTREIRLGIPAQGRNPLPDGHSAPAGFLQCLGVEPARQGAASGQASFFVGEDKDFQRVSGPDSILPQNLDALDGRHHPQNAVVDPCPGHGVDVGPQHNGGELGRTTLQEPRQVAGGVHSDLQAGFLH